MLTGDAAVEEVAGLAAGGVVGVAVGRRLVAADARAERVSIAELAI